jgi:acetyltransferase-like isoleucine patch superfamily enzyme
MGSRVVLEPGVCVKLVEEGATAYLADNVFVGRGVILDISERLTIGEGTLIAPGCFITDHNHGTAPNAPIWMQRCVARPVRIGAGAWLGAGVVVLPGVTIGDGAVVGAGAVVTRDVPPMTIAGGVPARPIRARSRSDESP